METQPAIVLEPPTTDFVCDACSNLYDLFEMTDKSDRAYFLMTEVFVALHGGDVCPLSEVWH